MVNRGIGVSRVGPAVEIPRRLARRDALDEGIGQQLPDAAIR